MRVLSTFLAGTVAAVAALVYYIVVYRPYTVKTPQNLNPQYEYIIVGGGTAGSVLAARLSENPAVNVLLLEAGDDHYAMPFAFIPSVAPLLQKTKIDWAYQTEPQEHACEALVGKQSNWPRGKCLGGSSMLNLMLYSRGHPSNWHNLKKMGLEGWGYEDVGPYFMKSETAHVEGHIGDAKHRGKSGPMDVQFQTDRTVLAELFMSTVRAMGYQYNEDYNNPVKDGFAWHQFHSWAGQRSNPARQYLEPAMVRPNLHVVTGAHVRKVLFNEANRAVGVEYSHSSRVSRVLTNREIVLSAGTIGTPQILMLSGVGDKEHLKAFKDIKLVKHLPAVGQNLIDHVVIDVDFGLNESIGFPLKELMSPVHAVRAAVDYFTKKSGPLAMNPFEVTGFFRSGFQIPTDTPDLQLMFSSAIPDLDIVRDNLNMKPEIFNATYKEMNRQFAATGGFGVALVNPKSRGHVRLRSSDPLDQPLIDPRYLSDPKDVSALKEGIKMMKRISDHAAFQRYGLTLTGISFPGCDQVDSAELWSDAHVECLIRHRTLTAYHPMGTCRMGTDKTDSVVDSRLRVHGMKGVRVVDASVFPTSIAGPPNAVVIMAAEKAAVMLMKDGQAERED